jgi:hypothetical protein
MPVLGWGQTGWTKIGLPAEPVTADNPGGENRVYAIRVDPTSNTLYAGCRSGGLMASTDEGTTWTYRRPGSSIATFTLDAGPNPRSIAINPGNPAKLYLGSEQYGMFYSYNFGNSGSWSRKNIGTNGLDYAFDPNNSNRVWFGATGGVWLSTDGGPNWTKTTCPGRTVTRVIAHPTDSNTIYTGSATPSEGVIKSTDGGATWVAKNSGFRSGGNGLYAYRAIFDLEMDPANPGKLHAVTVDGLYHTVNGGDLWTKTTPLFDPDASGQSPLFSLFVHPTTPSLLIGGTMIGRVYKSTDSGSTWTDITGTIPVGSGCTVTDIIVDPRDVSRLYVATWKGLYKTTLTGVGGGGGSGINPIAEWKFDNNASDSSGSNTAVLTNGAVYSTTAWQGSHSVSLDGVNDFVNIDNTSLEGALTERTVSIWVKANGTSATQTIYEEGGVTSGLGLRLRNNLLEAAVRSDGIQKTVSTPFTQTGWAHVAVACTLSGSTVVTTLFLNGQPVLPSLDTGFASIPVHTNPAGLGATNSSDAFGSSVRNYFFGHIDHVRIYDSSVPWAELADQAGLLGWLRLNNDFGDVLQNLAASGTGSPTFSTDSVEGGYSVDLNGTNQWINLDNDLLEQSFTASTVAIWVKADSTSGTRVIYEEGGVTNGLALRINNGVLQAAVCANGVMHTVSAPFASADWSQIAVTFNGGANGRLRLYANGVKVAEGESGFSIIPAHSGAAGLGATHTADAFGTSATGGYFDGHLDQFRVWTFELGESQIADLYAQEQTNP